MRKVFEKMHDMHEIETGSKDLSQKFCDKYCINVYPVFNTGYTFMEYKSI